MKVSITALLAVHQRDSSLPFWLANVDADSLFAAHSHRPEKAQAWLRFRNVSESCFGFGQAVLMNGHFGGGGLSSHTYHWTFTPGRRGDLAIVTPVLDGGRLVDFVSMSRHDHNVWAACLGTGQYLGSLSADRLRIHRIATGFCHCLKAFSLANLRSEARAP